MPDELNDIINKTANYIKFIKNYYPENILDGIEKLNFTEETKTESTDIYDIKMKKENNNLKETSFVRDVVSSGIFSEPWTLTEDIPALDKLICNCKKCELGNLRNNFVFGTGNSEAKVVLVGEAPGADEDREGKPFVGRAGKLLTDILAAINFSREEVFICNILKCRPPDNRNPLPVEIKECEPYLIKQLELIKPAFILALGTFAAQTLLKTNTPLGKLRGRFYDFIIGDRKIKLLVTYHPAALLRNPGWKRPTWEDVQLFKKEYDLYIQK
jgi:DNA polymerase